MIVGENWLTSFEGVIIDPVKTINSHQENLCCVENKDNWKKKRRLKMFTKNNKDRYKSIKK